MKSVEVSINGTTYESTVPDEEAQKIRNDLVAGYEDFMTIVDKNKSMLVFRACNVDFITISELQDVQKPVGFNN